MKSVQRERQRIRVLHVAEAAGGVDRYLKMLFKYMDRSRIENILICSQNFNVKDYTSLVDEVVQIPMDHNAKSKNNVETIRTIRGKIKQYKPDVVYGHSSIAGALLRIADLGINNKVIYNPHGWSFNMNVPAKKRNAYKLIERTQALFTDKIVCISDAEMNTAREAKICSSNKLQVIYNGIDFDEIGKTPAMQRKSLGIPEDAFVVGMVGRLCEQKAPDTFVKSADLIKKFMPNSYFIIVGASKAGSDVNDDEYTQKVKSLIREDNLEDSFLITGWVNNPVAYEKCFDVGMLLSRWEGFGLVIPEYMACGVPVIATNIDAIPFLIDNNKNGLLVDVDKPEQVANAVKKLLNQATVQNIRNCALTTAHRKFDAKRVALETDKLIEKMVMGD